MSAPPAIALTDIEREALTELVNSGVSRAAANLALMVGQEVLLSVPGVAIVTRSEAARAIGDRGHTGLVAVRQMFEGDFSGSALLIFPETNSLELVRAVTGGGLPLDDIMALEQEALAETGNIILNSCLGTIANILRRGLRMSLPDVLRGTGAELFGVVTPSRAGPADLVLVLYIDFTVNAHDIKGYIAMLMDLPALRGLKAVLAELITHGPGDMPVSGNAAP
jgi:chemotaxis protein CheC